MPNAGFSWGARLSEIAGAVWSYGTRGLTERVKSTVSVPSDFVKASAPTERTTSSTSLVKLKEMRMNGKGTVRVTFELASTGTYNDGFGQIWRNGAAYGIWRSQHGTTYGVFSEDLWFNDGDLIQLYVATNDASVPAKVRNFTVGYTDWDVIDIPPTVLMD